MKKLVLFFLAHIILVCTGYNQTNEKCINGSFSFIEGEELTYILSYSWLFVWTDVGEVTFSVRKDMKFEQETLHLKALGKSYPFYDRFFKVRDIYESWVEPETLRPIYFNRDIYEGGYTKENEYYFDWANNMVNARIRRRGGENRYYSIPIEQCTYDLVTAIYITRNFDFSGLTEGSSYPVSVILDRETYNVKYTFIAREEKGVKGAGKFKSLKFRVELVAGDVFEDGQYLYVWVTDDANKLPVYIESPIKVGSVKARISRWQGLVHPLSSKID